MMRVEVNMDEKFRGYVADYADIQGLSMPTAYRELIEHGLIRSDYELEEVSDLRVIDEERFVGQKDEQMKEEIEQ